MYKIDLYGDGLLTVILSHEEVETAFPPTVETCRRTNALARDTLRDVRKYPHDKATVETKSLRSRALLGTADKGVVSRIFTVTQTRRPNRRYATNIVILWGKEEGHPYCVMDGNPIYDLRTASTVAVGIECIEPLRDTVVCILGAGPVARTTALALGALQRPPTEIRMTARRRDGFVSVKERLNALFESLDPALLDRTRLVACETLREAIQGSTVVVDAISLHGQVPLIDRNVLTCETLRQLTYVDVGKQALDDRLVSEFWSYIFDNLEIGYTLDSPASKAIREGRCNVSARKCDVTQLLNREVSIGELRDPKLLTIMGVASIDAKIAEDGFERLSKA